MLFDVQHRRVYLMGLLVLCLNISERSVFTDVVPQKAVSRLIMRDETGTDLGYIEEPALMLEHQSKIQAALGHSDPFYVL